MHHSGLHKSSIQTSEDDRHFTHMWDKNFQCHVSSVAHPRAASLRDPIWSQHMVCKQITRAPWKKQGWFEQRMCGFRNLTHCGELRDK